MGILFTILGLLAFIGLSILKHKANVMMIRDRSKDKYVFLWLPFGYLCYLLKRRFAK